MTDLYKLPFKQAKVHLPRVYLSLSFIENLNLDILNLDIKAVYSASGLNPILTINGGTAINKYCIFLGMEGKPPKIYQDGDEKFIFIGYKHFDKWRNEDGSQIGEFASSATSKQLQRKIQRHCLGFFKYWNLRLRGKI